MFAAIQYAQKRDSGIDAKLLERKELAPAIGRLNNVVQLLSEEQLAPLQDQSERLKNFISAESSDPAAGSHISVLQSGTEELLNQSKEILETIAVRKRQLEEFQALQNSRIQELQAMKSSPSNRLGPTAERIMGEWGKASQQRYSNSSSTLKTGKGVKWPR